MADYTFEFTNGNYGVRFVISQTPNESNNTSTISISQLFIKGPGVKVVLDGQLYINNQHVWTASMYHGTHVRYVSGWTSEDVGSYTTISVPHNSDGSLTITLTLKPNDYSGFLICKTSDGSVYASLGNGTAQSQAGTANNVGKVRIYTSSGWVSATPYVYTSSGWVKAIPYVYTSSGWQRAK